MSTDLTTMRCRPLEGHAPMDADEIARHLPLVPGWALVDGAIEKHFAFPDFHRTIGFVNAVAWIANAEDHHPDLRVGYGGCTVRYNTHSVRGISINDFICAARIDALVAA
ncbi:MAG: 4a-hydroxytetrahydrobiopterin dehydratase [Rubrivivax sp.]|jgi:4a-hydroxytetrahydrobiopterin dehydratase|nr:4a-hydroxytetrahydrobiopterin dehydratase [Rubrivivax sp.]